MKIGILQWNIKIQANLKVKRQKGGLNQHWVKKIANFLSYIEQPRKTGVHVPTKHHPMFANMYVYIYISSPTNPSKNRSQP